MSLSPPFFRPSVFCSLLSLPFIVSRRRFVCDFGFTCESRDRNDEQPQPEPNGDCSFDDFVFLLLFLSSPASLISVRYCILNSNSNFNSNFVHRNKTKSRSKKKTVSHCEQHAIRTRTVWVQLTKSKLFNLLLRGAFAVSSVVFLSLSVSLSFSTVGASRYHRPQTKSSFSSYLPDRLQSNRIESLPLIPLVHWTAATVTFEWRPADLRSVTRK